MSVLLTYMQTFMSLVNQEMILNKSLVSLYYLIYFNTVFWIVCINKLLVGWDSFVTVVLYLNTTAKGNYIAITLTVPVEQSQYSYIFLSLEIL